MPDKASRLYVVTGPVGSGKTKLVDEFSRDPDFDTIPEYSADLIEDQLRSGGDLVPWKNRTAFERAVVLRRIQAHQLARPNRPIMCDRGIPDSIAFFRWDGLEVPHDVTTACSAYEYAPIVFILPFWPEIFCNSVVRPQSADEAMVVGQLLRAVYSELGYRLIDVPKLEVAQRVAFVRAHVWP